MGAIFKREFKSYFTNMLGAIFAAVLLAVVGIYMTLYNFDGGYPNFEYVLGGILFTFIVLVPLLTMRTIAEDRRIKTEQLLLSLPVSSTQIVLGKYLALLCFFLIPCGVIALYPLILSMYGQIFWATTYATLLAFILLSAALLAIGMYISSLTENQIVAAIISVFVVLLAYMADTLAGMIPDSDMVSYIGFIVIALIVSVIVHIRLRNSVVTAIVALVSIGALTAVKIWNPTLLAGTLTSSVRWLSLFGRIDKFIYGMFDVTSIVYYISVTVLFVFLTVQSLDRKRWS